DIYHSLAITAPPWTHKLAQPLFFGTNLPFDKFYHRRAHIRNITNCCVDGERCFQCSLNLGLEASEINLKLR
ncbi:hypothetical protein, partial [Nitrosomonas sp. ANs5]|uniref:hypothetical protein n=1 Tax=Nitrosomonas sp. ANs5 TaxID=3423941 RepID=UPI003D34F9B5